jgi:sodium-coupled neutral amino acid transporter 7/8
LIHFYKRNYYVNDCELGLKIETMTNIQVEESSDSSREEGTSNHTNNQIEGDGFDDTDGIRSDLDHLVNDLDTLVIHTSTSYNPQGTSTLATVFLIVNAALGAGLLNFPQQFHQAGGVMSAVLVQAVLLVFIMLALVILAKTANIKNSTTLQEVMKTACGVWGSRITSLIVAIYCFGTCITFLIIIGDQFDRAFFSLIGPDFCNTWYLNRDFVVPATSVVLILPLCFSERIDFLKYVSMAGVVTIVYIVALIIFQYFSGDYTPGEIKKRPDTWIDVFDVIPVICFGYQCHVSVIPIYSCMKQRNLKSFSLASSTAIAICVFTYTGAATFGYLTFGSKVVGDILENYSGSDPWVLTALIFMALKTYTTYPILLFCGREGISTLIKDLFISEDSKTKEIIRRICIASTWFVLSIILAIEIPDIGAVIGLLGSLAAVFIFIFPGLCLLQSSLLEDPGIVELRNKLKIMLAAFFMTLGTFIFGVVLTQGLIEDFGGTQQSRNLLCQVTTYQRNSRMLYLG